MNKYESVIIIKPSLSDKEVEEIINRCKKIIEESGEIVSVKDIGKKKLAYEIKGYEKGRYITFVFKSKATFNIKLEDSYRKDSNVMKYVIMRKED